MGWLIGSIIFIIVAIVSIFLGIFVDNNWFFGLFAILGAVFCYGIHNTHKRDAKVGGFEKPQKWKRKNNLPDIPPVINDF